jgi:hypothetical protein
MLALDTRIPNDPRDIFIAHPTVVDRRVDAQTFVIALRAVGLRCSADHDILREVSATSAWQAVLLRVMTGGVISVTIPDCVGAVQLFRTLRAFHFDDAGQDQFLCSMAALADHELPVRETRTPSHQETLTKSWVLRYA